MKTNIAGLEPGETITDSIQDSQPKRPLWMESPLVVKTLDARPIIEKGDQPFGSVVRELNKLAENQILELITPFLPVPINR